MTLEDMNSAISSQASADGRLLLNGQDGEAPSGREAVPVSRFRAQESEKAMPTNAISGPLFNASSPSAALQWSLESRLRQRMAGNGCPLYELTWSQWDMPAGPQICRQRASARRTSANGFTGWPTPMVHQRKYSETEMESLKQTGRTGRMGLDLTGAVQLTGWPTPKAGNGTGAGMHGDGGMDLQTTAQLSGWATPTERDYKDRAANLNNVPVNHLLGREVLLTGWPTPISGIAGGPMQRKDGKTNSNLEPTAQLIIGETSNGSPVPTERRGQLNPDFTRWLMGFPEEWCIIAPPATRKR